MYVGFKDNTWAADLAKMGSSSSKSWHVKYLLYMIDVLTKYAWVKSLKDKKAKTLLHDFAEIVNDSKRKHNKLRVDQGREFYNNLMQKSLDDVNMLMHSTHNEDKSVVVERFTRNFRVNSCFYYLNNLVDEYYNTYHRATGKKSVDVDYSALFEAI